MTLSAGPIVIVGAGQAGGWCAMTLRREGFAGEIIVIGDEPHPPYERPPLSKGLLTGKTPVEKTYLQPADWYAANGITLLLGARAESVDRSERRVRLSDGRIVPYGTLVLATGARARELPGAAPDVLHLRTIGDSAALRSRLVAGQSLTVIGAGLIGLEVAAAARELGVSVVAIEAGAYPMGRVVPRELGVHFLDIHRGRGVEILTGLSVRSMARSGGRAVLELSDGRSLVADTVLVAIGSVPNVAIAENCGLPCDDGILVDEFGRTSDASVWAVGDCVRLHHSLLGRRIRLETWHHAQEHAIAVAKNILGRARPYAAVPWSWTDQYDINLQIAGTPAHWDEIVWRGDPRKGPALLFQLEQGRVVGGATLNAPREMRFIRQMIERRSAISPAILADPSVQLRTVLG